jgi:hypothetical protein
MYVLPGRTYILGVSDDVSQPITMDRYSIFFAQVPESACRQNFGYLVPLVSYPMLQSFDVRALPIAEQFDFRNDTRVRESSTLARATALASFMSIHARE